MKKLLFVFLMFISCTNKQADIKSSWKNLYYSYANMIMQEEGLRLKAYRCSERALTIGYGHKLLKGEKRVITEHEAENIFYSDYDKAIQNVYWLFPEVNDETLFKLAVLSFQVGNSGFAEFKDFIKAVKFAQNNDNPDAKMYIYLALKSSKWAKQCPDRANRYIERWAV
jgi:lysozyme